MNLHMTQIASRRVRGMPDRTQAFGSVTPRWPWYLPPRSL
jgi:hypothetical protein